VDSIIKILSEIILFLAPFIPAKGVDWTPNRSQPHLDPFLLGGFLADPDEDAAGRSGRQDETILVKFHKILFLGTRTNFIKFLTAVYYECPQKTTVFLPDKLFQPSPMFTGKAGSYPSEAAFWFST
jgi:hypothetical protein